jgi:hypothetical protein
MKRMKKDGANHIYEECQNVRMTYVPAKDRATAKNWAGCDVIRIQSHKNDKDNALHMGAELPLPDDPTVFVDMISKLCAVFSEGRKTT